MLVAAVVVAAVLVLGGGGEDDRTTGAAADGAAHAADPGGSVRPKKVGDPIPVAEMPVGVATDDGTVAVASRSGAALTMIDQKTGKPEGNPVPLPGEGEDVAIAAGAAWVTVPDLSRSSRCRSMGVTRRRSTSVAAVRDHLRRLVGLGRAARGPADHRHRSVHRRPSPIRSGSTDLSPSEIASGDGRLWVVDRGGKLFSLDPDDPSAQDSQDVGANPKGVVVADGSVWVANTNDGNVDHFDTDGTKLGSVKVGGTPRLLAAGFGRIWVANGNGYVSAIDPADDSVDRVEHRPAPPPKGSRSATTRSGPRPV